MTVVGGEVVEREIPLVGMLRFEDCKAGEWLTQKGEPAKIARRRYMLNDVELDSVSSIVDTLHKGGLVRWAEDHGTRGGARAQAEGELDGVPADEIFERVRELGYGSDAVKGEATDRGNAVHAAFEMLARTGGAPNLADYPEQWHGWMRGAAAAWLELDPFPAEIETTVCHSAFGYAGRFDLIAVCGGRRTLIDYKTGKGKVFDSAHFQTRLYEMALEASGIDPVARVVIVGVDDVGGHQVVDCEASWEHALSLVDVFRARKAINAGMAAQRKAAKAKGFA